MTEEKLFNEIYDETYNNILNFVISKTDRLENVKDIMQNIYINVYKTIRRKGIAYIEDFNNFVFKVAKREIYKHYTLKNKVKIVFYDRLESLDNELYVSKKIEFDHAYSDENLIAEEIWDFISLQKVTIQKIMMLHYKQGLTIKEISSILKLNESTVKSNLYRTLDKIRERYGVNND